MSNNERLFKRLYQTKQDRFQTCFKTCGTNSWVFLPRVLKSYQKNNVQKVQVWCKNMVLKCGLAGKMECYATPWPLWRESRILVFFTELYYPKNLPLSFVVGSCSLLSVFMRVNACLQAQGLALGTAIRAVTQLKTEKREQLTKTNYFHTLLLLL